ncbi:MAG: DUF2459 domain-containing protein [Pseudomonadota bacterium]|nr:DUF2459 domain-containing protein [Pseudomonadota bacterium]
MVRKAREKRRPIGPYLALLAPLAIPGCTTRPGRADTPLAPPGAAIVYVIDRGWHTDIGLPVAELGDTKLATIATAFPGARFLVFGFGERAYVLARHKTLGTMLAALLPSRAVILVTALAAVPADAFTPDSVVALRVTRSAADRIADFTWASLEKDPRGKPRRLADGPYPGSLFYAAPGTYDVLHTCNTWTAEALQAGGLPVRSFGIVLSAQLDAQVRRLTRSTPPGARVSASH